MSDDCVNDTCGTPIDCCERDVCILRPERSRIQQIIDTTRERLRREK